ncbi:MAG: response regulator [Bacteroidales bacterium]|nr:response regulator [Candidatus Latescibacterota bacterium]
MSLNVLVVDDSKIIRAVIKKTLGLSGVPVAEFYQAENGQEALDILKDNWVDIIFADINMPVMNGIEMVERMAEDGILKTTPVIMVSTEGSALRIKQLKEKGVSAYIRKPFTPELLREVVDSIVEVRCADSK